MTTLEACNEILESIGEERVTVLDTGGTSDAANAERILDRESRRVQGRGGYGWAQNRLKEFSADVPDIRVTYTGADPAFTWNERVVQQTSGAFGRFAYMDATNNFLFVIKDTNSPAFTNSVLNLVGQTSAVTQAGDAFSAVPDTRLAYSGGDPTFTANETVTQGTSGATGTFIYTDATNDYVWVLRTGAVPFTSASLDIVGGTSGLTKTCTAAVVYDIGRLVVPSTWIYAKRADVEWKRVVNRGGFLYDLTTPGSETAKFTSACKLFVVEYIVFTSLSDKLQEYIVRKACLTFQRKMKRGQIDEALAQQALLMAKIEAEQEDGDSAETNVFQTNEMRRATGNRNDYAVNELIP